jgi:hypothetical protein
MVSVANRLVQVNLPTSKYHKKYISYQYCGSESAVVMVISGSGSRKAKMATKNEKIRSSMFCLLFWRAAPGTRKSSIGGLSFF